MPAAPRPFFHVRSPVPLTGREPIMGRLRGRLQHLGRGWGQVILTGPREAGTSRLLDECERLLGTWQGRPMLRVRPAYAGAAPLEPLRQAFLACFARSRRDEVRAALASAVSARKESDRLLAWILDGPLVGIEAPDGDIVGALLRALQPGGPLLVDDLARLDPDSRTIILREGAAQGVGLLAGNSQGDLGPAEARWPLAPLSESQVELLLRRWLRHPVTTRRLTTRLHRHTGGWPGALVRAVRHLGRSGALEETSRGVRIVTWPPPLAAPSQPPTAFPAWVRSQSSELRRVLTIAALQGEAEDDHFLARAASVRLHVVTDARAEIEEVFPAAAGRLFPGTAERVELVHELEGPELDAVVRALHRTWSRRREELQPRAASRAARLRVAMHGGDVAAAAATLARFVASIPQGASPDAEGRSLLEDALDFVPAGAMGIDDARGILEQATAADPTPGPDEPGVAGRAARHEVLAERALARGRRRARAAHLRRAARLHEAHGAGAAAASAWGRLADTEAEGGRMQRSFDARMRAVTALDALGDRARASAMRHRAADIGVELAAYDRAVELLDACLVAEEAGVDRDTRCAAIHLSLARAHHGRGDVDAERRHAEAVLVAGATDALRLGAEARLLALRVRAGDDEAGARLAELPDVLERSNLPREAAEARRTLATRRHLEDVAESREPSTAPAARLRRARRALLAGRPEDGRATLAALAEDPAAGIDIRVEALARLAHARLRADDDAGAHEAACRADALLEVGRRSRANDATLHHLLAVAFRALGEMGRAIRHRRASRNALRQTSAPALPTASTASGT